jgi:hypothetical protein
MANEYVCALSGVEADEDALVEAEDAAGALPEGWTKVTFQRRLPNPRFTEIQQAKGALVEVTLGQIPEEARDQMRPLVAIQVDAQFAALESNTDEWVLDEEVLFVAPPETDASLATEYFELRDRFGLSNDGFGAGDEDDNEEQE